jgi:hypothetical protein
LHAPRRSECRSIISGRGAKRAIARALTGSTRIAASVARGEAGQELQRRDMRVAWEGKEEQGHGCQPGQSESVTGLPVISATIFCARRDTASGETAHRRRFSCASCRPFLPRVRAGNGRHRTRGWSCGRPPPHALRRLARTPRVWRRPLLCDGTNGPRLLFPANLLPFPACRRRSGKSAGRLSRLCPLVTRAHAKRPSVGPVHCASLPAGRSASRRGRRQPRPMSMSMSATTVATAHVRPKRAVRV